MTTAIIAALAVALAVTAGWLVAAYARARQGGTDSERPRTMLGKSKLERELERAQAETRRVRQLATVAGTIDLDELLSRVLQSAAVLADADAAAVALWQEGEPPVLKAMNLPVEDALPLLGGWRRQGRPRAVTIRYRFAESSTESADGAVQIGVLLPLTAESDEPVGTLGVFWKRASDELREEQLAALEELAAGSSRAIENARRFRELHELAIRDPLSGLHNRRYFHDTLAHEVKRAHRYSRRLALIFFDLDDFKAVNERIGHLGGDGVLAEVAERLRSVTRGSDIPCRVGGDEFAVILPEAALEDAELLFERLQQAIQGRPIGRADNLGLSAGMAELRNDEDATAFFRRVDHALYRAKRSGKGQVVAADDGDMT
jgi:diguanylate cyclase (GGDEF)-like protein